MKLTKRGPFYWVDFREPSGKRRRISTGESDEAKAYAKAGGIVQAAMVAPLPVPQDTRISLRQALESTYTQHWGRSKSSSNMRAVCNLLQRELGDIKIAE